MKTGSKEEFWKIFLCRDFTNSPIGIHKFSLESSHLFGNTSFDSYFFQNQNFHWKPRKMRTGQKMGAYYLRKWDFDSKDSKWVFEIDFERDLLRKVLYFKIREINLKKKTKHNKQNTNQNKRWQNHKVHFFTIEKI